jgi:hypothetical protein
LKFDLQARAERDTDSERPACFKIMPTMFAVRLTPTLLRVRKRSLVRAHLVTISSSRCQTTRTLRRSTKCAELVSSDEQYPLAQHQTWWSQTGSNRRPPACKAGALPTELWPRFRYGPLRTMRRLVGLGRLELPTSRLSSARSNQLSYKPKLFKVHGPAAKAARVRPEERET